MKNQKGRSMVEMLGVLAIIGVLSVGAIAGYSKAMFKYKLNKLTEQYNYLLHMATNVYKEEFQKLSEKGTTNLYPILQKMNAMPDGMIVSSTYAYDFFNYRSRLNSRINQIDFYLQMTNNKVSSKDFIEVCKQFYTSIIIPRQNEIYATAFWYSDDMGSGLTNRMWGNSNCSSGNECLKDLSLSDIDTLCRSGQKERNFTLYITWK